MKTIWAPPSQQRQSTPNAAKWIIGAAEPPLRSRRQRPLAFERSLGE
jgi:hypothetical protein